MTTSIGHHSKEMDATAPGGVYLCQFSDTVSCGACCGLYNVADLSRPALEDRLRHRSLVFAKTPRTAEAIEAFALNINALEPQQRPFEDFHHCPFIGLIGEGYLRAGCLLHPLSAGNQGIDYRGMSYYGGFACRTYFCRSAHMLAPRHKRIVRRLATDWFTYGLIVTEHLLLAAFFAQLEAGLEHPVREEMFPARSKAAENLRTLLMLKMAWPFHPAGNGTACHYFFEDNRHPRPKLDYQQLDCPPSPYDLILTQLGSSFETLDQLRCAEQMVGQKIRAVASALKGSSGVRWQP